MNKLLTLKETSDILNVSSLTLRNWDNCGKLKAVKTIGGHRRYNEEDVKKFIGQEENEEINKYMIDMVAIYSRVSSHEQKQKGDLDRQCQRITEYCVKKKYVINSVIKDVGSGLSDTRIGFLKLIDLVINRKINRVIVEHKDRLTRFQFNIIVIFFSSYGVEIECMEIPNKDSEEEFVNDIMMLMASFSGKLYGKRSAKRRKEKKIEVESKENGEQI
jgi:excisionase family DNA binding protein